MEGKIKVSKKNKKASAAESGVKRTPAESRGSAKKGSAVKAARGLTMHEKFAGLFVISMLSIFPIYMTDKLFHIRTDRLQYFEVTTFVLLFFIVATYICGIDRDRKPQRIFKMSVADWAFIAFVVVCLISACLSEYGKEAFTGSEGRDSGFWLMAVYLLCFLLVSRYFKYKEVVFTIFAVMASVICFIGVLHEFSIDPFGLIVDIKKEQQKDFISTIGNINMFSAFVCVALPVCSALLVTAKDTLSAIFYAVTLAFCSMGLLVANSLSGYFGLISFMAVLFVFCCAGTKRIYRYFLTITVMLMSTKILRLMSLFFNDEYKNLQDVSYFLIFDNRVFILLAVFAAVTAALYFLCRKKGDLAAPKWVQPAAGAIVALAALAVVGVFVYFSFIDKETDLGKFSKLLRLNDQWGTHRGYAWIRGMILFKSNGIKNILVGSGPDTFSQLIKGVYREDMLKRHGSIFDTAHNEFLNYLVTTGVLGFAAYVTLLVSILVRAIRRCRFDETFIIVMLPIIGYASQSVFSLATPIITPFLFLFLALTEAHIRRYDLEHEEKFA